MDNNLVLIPSLGIVTTMGSINFPITLSYSAKYVYSLVRDESIYNSKEMMVKRTLEIDSKALISFDFPKSVIAASASEVYNNFVKEIVAAEADDSEEDEKPKKKRRRSEEDNDSAESLTKRAMRIAGDLNFHEIIVNRDMIEQLPVSITQTRPYQERAQKHEEILLTNLAKLSKAVTLRAEALQHSHAPDETLGGSVDDLLPELSSSPDIGAINRAGLQNYEEKLKQDIENKTNLINNLYNWFDTNVIEKFNSKSQMISGIINEEELRVADVTIRRQEILDNLFANEIIFLNPNTSKKK